MTSTYFKIGICLFLQGLTTNIYVIEMNLTTNGMHDADTEDKGLFHFRDLKPQLELVFANLLGVSFRLIQVVEPEWQPAGVELNFNAFQVRVIDLSDANLMDILNHIKSSQFTTELNSIIANNTKLNKAQVNVSSISTPYTKTITGIYFILYYQVLIIFTIL